MHEVWSQELQCYRTRNASQVRLKYTCFYLCSVRIVSGLIFRISTETLHSGTTWSKPNLALPTQYGVALSLRVTLASCFAFW